MKKTEFLNKLREELEKRNVADAADILEEYEQHFDLKLADGFFEEEIAARLGDPAILAAQFDETERAPQKESGSKPLTVIGLGFADVFAGLFFLLLAGFGIVLAAAALSFGVAAVCLLGGLNIHGLLLAMPYWCGVILGLSLLALTALFAVGCVYYGAFLRQLIRSFGRFQHNAMANASGLTALPPLPISPQFSAKAKRRLRVADLTGAVRRLFRTVLCGVCPVRRKSPVLACMGLVRELR